MQTIVENFEFSFPLSAEGQKICANLVADVRKHNQAVEALQAAIETLRQAATENWTVKYDGEVAKLKERRAKILTAEMELRGRIAQWLERVAEVEVPAEIEAAIAQGKSLKEKLHADLLALGFVDDIRCDFRFDKVIGGHPQVWKLCQRRDRVLGKSVHLAPLQANQAAIRGAQRELDELKAQALAGLDI